MLPESISALHGRRVVVTGATGFIGVPLMLALHRAGANLIAIVGKGRRIAVFNTLPFPVQRMLVYDLRRTGDVIREAAPDFVVHFSAHMAKDRSFGSLAKTLERNLLSTVDVLTACAQIGVARVILMGSTEEYGQNAAPFDPSLASHPPTPYETANQCRSHTLFSIGLRRE